MSQRWARARQSSSIFASIAAMDAAATDHIFPGDPTFGMPPVEAFDCADLYSQSLNHECVHATQAAHRVGRDFKKRYGEHAYHVEEITAELGAAYLGAHFGMAPDHLHDHSAYIGHWIKLLEHDRRAFFDADNLVNTRRAITLRRLGVNWQVYGDRHARILKAKMRGLVFFMVRRREGEIGEPVEGQDAIDAGIIDFPVTRRRFCRGGIRFAML